MAETIQNNGKERAVNSLIKAGWIATVGISAILGVRAAVNFATAAREGNIGQQLRSGAEMVGAAAVAGAGLLSLQELADNEVMYQYVGQSNSAHF